jgi:hypothetical protein
MAGKAVAAVKSMLERVGIKAPWKASITAHGIAGRVRVVTAERRS